MTRAAAVVTAMMAACHAFAQLPGDEWELEDGYDYDLLNLHAYVNYAYDLEWQFDWERRRFADNALRVNTGSVSSTQLLTDIEININERLNDQWRFFGQFTRQGFRRRPVRQDLLLLGFERRVLGASAIYVGVNPQFNKDAMDVEIGYGWYGNDREEYLRVGVRSEDLTWDAKNSLGGEQVKDPLKLVWSARLALSDRVWLYSEGRAGSGYERRFPDADASPDLLAEDQRENTAELRLTIAGEESDIWAVAAEWYDFERSRRYRTAGFDYDYESRQLRAGIEHVRRLGERHRLRLLAQFVSEEASSRGFREHDYERQDVLAGIFYEYRWPSSGLTVAYAGGQPDFTYDALDPADSYNASAYADKLIAGWRYTFSENAVILFSVSHEVSERGFGGGSVQYQMFF